MRVFDFRSGKLRRKYDESRKAMEAMIARGQLKMDAMDLGKKSAVEKELEVHYTVHYSGTKHNSLYHLWYEPFYTNCSVGDNDGDGRIFSANSIFDSGNMRKAVGSPDAVCATAQYIVYLLYWYKYEWTRCPGARGLL